MSEKFSIKWNDFESNVSKSFGKLRNEEYLHDVTLVGDDHTQMSAQKLVLSACSEYFKEVFKRNKHSNTLMCFEGLSEQDLQNVLDYMYNGEVHIYQEELDRFLSIAQRLKLEGLLETKDNENSEDIRPRESVAEEHFYHNTSPEPELNDDKRNLDIKPKTFIHASPNNTVSLNTNEMSEIDAKLEENLELLDGGHFRCTICGKDSIGMTRNQKQNMKSHVETHLGGLCYPCQLCGKEFRSKQSLCHHKRLKHKNSFQDKTRHGQS